VIREVKKANSLKKLLFMVGDGVYIGRYIQNLWLQTQHVWNVSIPTRLPDVAFHKIL